MGALIEIAGTILARANARAELSANNIANMTTPGFKGRRSFQSLIDDRPGTDGLGVAPEIPAPARRTDWSNGKLVVSHNPLDLAVVDNGLFMVRKGEAVFYTRSGQFSRDANGYLVTATGLRLQGQSGDISISDQAVTIDADGTIHDGDQNAQEIRLVDFADKTALFDVGDGLYQSDAAAEEVASPDIRQGMLESSNVSDGSEMTGLMAALRSAETGQRLVQLYDDLISHVVTSFGRGAA